MKRKCFRDFDIVSGPTWQPPPVLSGCERGADFGGQFGPTARPGGFHFVQFSLTKLLTVKNIRNNSLIKRILLYLSRYLRRAVQYPRICFSQSMWCRGNQLSLRFYISSSNYTSGSQIVIKKSTCESYLNVRSHVIVDQEIEHQYIKCHKSIF